MPKGNLKAEHLSANQLEWISQKSQRNLLIFYAEELLSAHNTKSKPDIALKPFQKLKKYGFLQVESIKFGDFAYSLSPEALLILKEVTE